MNIFEVLQVTLGIIIIVFGILAYLSHREVNQVIKGKYADIQKRTYTKTKLYKFNNNEKVVINVEVVIKCI